MEEKRDDGENLPVKIIEIADLTNVSEKTVRTWIKLASVKLPKVSGKTSEARRFAKPADFDLEEVISIVRAGGKNTLADLLYENARLNQGPSKPGNRTEIARRVLSGSFIRELRLTMGAEEAARRIDYLLGYSRRETPISPDEAIKKLSDLREQLKQLKKEDQLTFNLEKEQQKDLV